MHSTLSLNSTTWDEQVHHGERQLKEFSKFLQHHDAALSDLLYKSVVPFEFVDGSDSSTKPLAASKQYSSSYQQPPPWPSKDNVISPMQQYVPIGIDYNYPSENISTLELIATDNQSLNKMVAVFVQLCAEVRCLMDEGDVILLNCLYADEDLCQLYCDDDELNETLLANVDTDLGNLTSAAILKLNKLLEFLCQTQYFIERCFVVISDIIKQLAALFAAEDQYYINVNYSSLHFQSVFNYLGELSVLIIKFDNVFAHGQIQRLWPHYIKLIRLIERNLDKMDMSKLKKFSENSQTDEELSIDDVQGLENILKKLEFLFTGDLFQILVDSLFQIKKQITGQALPIFSTHFQAYLKNTLSDIQKYAVSQSNSNSAVNTPSPSTPSANVILEILFSSSTDVIIDPSKAILKMNAMCILFHNIFGNLDQKVFSTLIECTTKFPCITLLENLIWSPETFLQRYAVTIIPKVRGSADKISATNIARIQQAWLQTKCQKLAKDTQIYCVQVTTWILKMRNLVNIGKMSSSASGNETNNIKIDELNQSGVIILQGLQLMEKLSSTINAVTSLHVQLKCPMTKQIVLSICKLIEFLKIIKLTFTEHSSSISETAQSLAQYQIYQMLFIISPARKTLSADSGASPRSSNFSYNERIIDTISALELAETALFGPPNTKRILTARLALSMTDPKRLFTSDQLSKLCRLFVSIEHFIQLPKTIQTLAASSFMYWHHNTMLPIYLRHTLDQNGGMDSERILYLFNSSVDCQNELMDINRVNFNCSTRFMDAMASHLNRFVIAKLCGHIETILRIDVHANLQLLETNELDPFATPSSSNGTVAAASTPMADLCRLVQLKPFHITTTSARSTPGDKFLIVRDHIGSYLSQMFYNLTTVSMHDWRTYGEMRYAAKRKFQLDTIEDHLPTQTLEQGLDVLEIMRNIHLFVSNYLYNLNNQIFVEQNSNNKHLNTINIKHIANSLRTHGTGIINTTVNFTYQFLRKKFFIFSQFLYDEHIQSRLMKDLKAFRSENVDKTSEHQMYSYEKANNFNRSIRQLGISENGQSPLDLFRQLITHIGNAMGYVRMMRSGGIHCCANASVFLPIVDANLEFVSLCERDNLSDTTQYAAKNLECDITHLKRNYAEGTEYFKLLVDAFSPFFRSEKNPHLKLFFLIVPPLTINYIEYIITAKEKMNKKTKQQGTLFTDDGFAMGMAYVLKLLNQTSEFNSLHWFKAVRKKYGQERERLLNDAKVTGGSDGAKVTSSLNQQSYDAKLQQTLALSEKRINMILQEFDLLYCNLSSAKIFFQ